MPTLEILEDDLEALLNTEELVPEEDRPYFEQQLAQQILKCKEKCDALGLFLDTAERDAKKIQEQIEMLQSKKKAKLAQAERLRGYVQGIIQRDGVNEEGDYRQLKGSSFTFFLRRQAPQVDISQEDLIPHAYQDLKVSLPASTWDKIEQALQETELGFEIKEWVKDEEATPNKTRIRSALQAGEYVPGAFLTQGVSLVVR